jgi:hypothetical protein
VTPAQFSKLCYEIGIDDLHPQILDGWQRMALGSLKVLVTAKRGKYPDDPALGMPAEQHLMHADDHARSAYHFTDDDAHYPGYLDDDGLPHMDHCTARVALAHARLAVVSGDIDQ